MAPFASPAELSVWLQREIPEAQAAYALSGASAAIRACCGWSISAETVTGQVVSSYGRRSIWLPTLYLTGVISVVENGVTLVAAVDYDWTTDGRLIRSSRWWTVPRDVVVTYTHGYPAGHPVLESVKAVCLAAASRMVVNPLALRSWTLGDESETYMGTGSAVGAFIADGERQQLAHVTLLAVA